MKPLPLLEYNLPGRRHRKPPRFQPPPPKEIKLQMDVAETLRLHGLPTWRWTHFPAGEERSAKTGARLKRMGLKPGWPDWLLISPEGKLHCLELKRRGCRLSTSQKEFREFCLNANVPHMIAYSLADVLLIFDAWGCLRIRISAVA